MGTAPKQNQTRNVEKAQLKKYVKSYNSHKFCHDGDGHTRYLSQPSQPLVV